MAFIVDPNAAVRFDEDAPRIYFLDSLPDVEPWARGALAI